MSLILEALDKADREHEEQPAVPDLKSVHGTASSTQSRAPQHIPLYIVAVLLALIFSVLLVMLLRQPSAHTEMTPLPSAPRATVASSGESGEVLGEEPREHLASVQAHQDAGTIGGQKKPGAVESLRQKAHFSGALPEELSEELSEKFSGEPPAKIVDQRIPSEEGRVRVQAKPASSSAQPIDPDIAALYTQSQNTQKQNVRRQAVPGANQQPQASVTSTPDRANANTTIESDDDALLKAMWEQVKREFPDDPMREARDAKRPELVTSEQLSSRSINAYHDIPFLHELPENTQALIPSIRYSNHIYSGNGGVVILNGKTLRDGDALEADMVVDTVLEDGVIMRQAGNRFKLGELSSWINMP